MKKILFVFAISTILLSACGNKKNKQTEAQAHEHGKECSHGHEQAKADHHQEAFVVETDSTKACGSSCAGCEHATPTCKTEEGHSHETTDKAHSHDHQH